MERRREGTKLENRDPPPSVSEELLGSKATRGSSAQDYRAGHLALSQPRRAAFQGQLLFHSMVGGGVISALPGDAGQ